VGLSFPANHVDAPLGGVWVIPVHLPDSVPRGIPGRGYLLCPPLRVPPELHTFSLFELPGGVWGRTPYSLPQLGMGDIGEACLKASVSTNLPPC